MIPLNNLNNFQSYAWFWCRRPSAVVDELFGHTSAVVCNKWTNTLASTFQKHECCGMQQVETCSRKECTQVDSGSLEPDLYYYIYKVWETILWTCPYWLNLLWANQVGKCTVNFICFILIGQILRVFAIVSETMTFQRRLRAFLAFLALNSTQLSSRQSSIG